ncbi:MULTISPECIES: flagellar hook protein FlgE [Ochrobactrum]|uniref:Flagellar hook protein FlgE n=1 Tax=Ochrobactrum chromiisoli TaxID=2993941 RepID=A0ABT3QPH1_9HYPH|nr:flagellar hook protein FlgE [Ochrobactrum chromiisoli]MCX2697506.1 flagellar hook protein FlgE [Ochrobactrum chromiisoli]
MSLYGMMRTGVSGMNAQANRLSAVAENIANASTVGYKRAETQFSSLVLPSTAGQYNSGSVLTNVRYGISDQGGIRSTASRTDLAIDGNGFFVVQGADGTSYLTRAGSFVPDKDGYLVNTAGYYLLGAGPDESAGGLTIAGLERINANAADLEAQASTSGTFTVSLPLNGQVPAAGEFNHKTSLISYDSQGKKITLDVYFTKSADNNWDVSVKNAADGVEVGTTSLEFDPANGDLVAGGVVSVDLTGYNGSALSLNLGASKEASGEYTISEAVINGQAKSSMKSVDVASDGSIVGIYENGSQVILGRIPLAKVPSPDRMTVVSGNVFLASAESGEISLGFPQSSGIGKVMSGSLEESKADIAQELTDMIEAQRSYTANSKVFQTGSELMDVLVNLKR